MSSIQLRNTRVRVAGFLTTLAVTFHVCLATQPPPAVAGATEQDAAKDALPALRQPGDDVTPELKDPVRETDPKKIESRAAYMEGLAAQKDGNLTDAIKAFQKAADADPTAPEPVRAHAVLLRRLGRTRQAEEMARKAIDLDPEDYEMRLELAGLLLSRQHAAEASALIESALASKKLDHKSADFINLHSVRGRLYLLARNAAKAAESYSVILQALEKPEDFGLDFRQHQALMTDRATGYETVGKIMLEVGSNDKAIAAFTALIRIGNDTPGDDHYWLALAQYRKDDLEPAEANLNRYFESNKRSRNALQLLSDLYRATSRSDSIVKRLSELAENTNDADAVNMFLGDLLVDMGDGEEASKVYHSVITNSGDAAAYLGLIRVDILNRDSKSLLKSVNKALRARIQREELAPLTAHILLDTSFAEAVVNVAVESLQDGDFEQNPAATFFYSQIADRLELIEPEGKLLQATLDQNPAPRLGIEAMGRLGLNLYMQERFTEAADTFKKLLSIPGLPAGETAMTLYRLSAAEAANEHYDAAITAIETALKVRPENAELTYQLGFIQFQASKYEEAERNLKSAINLSDSDPKLEPRCRILLGSLYSQLRRWDEAIIAYNELLNMPEITDQITRRARMALSNAYVQNGDLPNGEKILEEVYQLEPDSPGVNNDLGYLYADQNKNLEKAEKMIRIAVAAEPENPAYLDSLGWVLYRLGRHEEAIQALEKANSNPDYRDSTIIEHLGDAQKAFNKSAAANKSWQEALDVEKKSPSPDKSIIERLTEKIKANPPPSEN